MNKQVAVICLVSALVLVSSALGFASQDPFVGEGVRINLVQDWEWTINVDQACWIRHGWGGDRFPGMQPELKDEYDNQKFVAAGHMTFKLYIDNREVKLRPNRVIVPGEEPGTRTVRSLYYVQFEPYHFDLEPGVYELKGVWDMSNPNCRDMQNLVNAGEPFYPLPLTSTGILTVLPVP